MNWMVFLSDGAGNEGSRQRRQQQHKQNSRRLLRALCEYVNFVSAVSISMTNELASNDEERNVCTTGRRQSVVVCHRTASIWTNSMTILNVRMCEWLIHSNEIQCFYLFLFFFFQFRCHFRLKKKHTQKRADKRRQRRKKLTKIVWIMWEHVSWALRFVVILSMRLLVCSTTYVGSSEP